MSKCLHTSVFLPVLYLVLVPLLTIEGSCPVGHYCPTEGEQIPCPRGFFNPDTDSTDWTACQKCPGGQYCATEGLASPTGNCTAGWFCKSADITPTPYGNRCWPRHFCLAGSTFPSPCPINTFNYDYEQTECNQCPVGHFCNGKELIGKCYEGYHCSASSVRPNGTACLPGTYCTDGLLADCPKGTMQPYEGMNECQPCPVGKYCSTEGLSTYTGSCSDGWWCGLGSNVSEPEGQSCPPGHRCTGGFKIACGAGRYQLDPGQQDCIPCPAGFYCGSEATVSPTPCAEGQCCHAGFIEPASCHQGDFLHLIYEATSQPTFAEANALCVAQGRYQLAVIDTSEEYDRLMAWFLDTSTYVTDGTLNLPDGVWLGAYWGASTSYEWNMCFDNVTLTWGDWATGQDPTPDTQQCLILNQDNKFENVNCGDRHDILCETCSDCDAGNYYNNDTEVCELCPPGMYCSRKGLLAPSGYCADTFHCNPGGAFSPHQEPCSPGSNCSGGFQTECPAGFYQPNARSSECLLCTAGFLCNEIGLQYPTGLCEEGYYCPAGSNNTYDDGFICPAGHSCPPGSGVPIPCENGRYQKNMRMGYCPHCVANTFCNQDFAVAEKQSGPDSPTHGVVNPKLCPPPVDCQGGNTFHRTLTSIDGQLVLDTITCDSDMYVPGELNLELSCSPPCDGGPVSSQEDISFMLTCPTCLADMTSISWSFRRCYLQPLFQCVMCYRRINYIDDHNMTSLTYSKKWNRFDTSNWKYFVVFVKVETSDGKEGMAHSAVWSFFDPYEGPVNCTVSPDNGQPMDTLFSINCEEVQGQSKLTLMYYLSVYGVEIFQGTTAMTGLQLPEALPEDNFDLPLNLVTRSNIHVFYETNFTVKIYPPVDGAFSDWSAWSGCSESCGLGSWSRSRDCTNPAPAYGGADCVGDTSETDNCNIAVCPPEDGGYTAWTSWTSCTLTCGTGGQTRTRECTNPVPRYGGADCVGDPTQTQDCNTNPCPIDGGLTEWSAWDGCTKSCASGTQTRSRDCTNPTPQYGGADCVGTTTDSQACNTQPCPIDGGYTIWTAWGACSLTCGTGSQSRSRDCTNPVPQHGGADCVGDSTQSQDCLLTMCAIDGQYSDWSLWDTCTQSCGTGSQTRTRACDNPAPQYGGSDCVGSPTEMQNCNVQSCPIDGGFTEWGSWGTCTQTCGTGSRTRSRDCTNPAPQYGGADCIGDILDSEDCNSNLCPVDGAFSDWSAWSGCSESCGLGSWSRSRDCTNPAPAYGGADCVGDTSEIDNCNIAVCPPEDGGYTAWTSWTTCTLTCGTGGQTRTRECTNPVPRYGGADCVGDPTQTQDCNTNPCPIDGGLTEWSAWDGCTKSCASGTQTRTRDCTNPTPQYGGADCVGTTTDSQACNTQPCPIDGGYTIWTAWGACSLTCGVGSEIRSRDCTNPTPQYGGSDCVGDSTQSKDCTVNICPVDGLYSDWSLWTDCTKTCATGIRTRARACDNPAPQFGGSYCVGSPAETENCNTDPCPIDGGFTEWTPWSLCTLTCGTGQRSRSHDCTNPVPQHGGVDCVGDAFESEDCNTNLCPVYEGYVPGVLKITFSCLPKCTGLMSSAVDILFGLECDDCRTSTVNYTWTLRQCTTYSVGSCNHWSDKMYFINNSTNTYTYRPAELASQVTGWVHFGMFIKAELEDGNAGMTYHIWKFFDPAVPLPSCSTTPPSGLSMNTKFSVACEDVITPEDYNISYSLYKDDSLLVLLYKGDTPNITDLLLPAGFEDGMNNLHLCMVARIQGHRFYITKTIVQVLSLSLEEIMGNDTGDSQSSGEAGVSAIDQLIQEGDVYGAIQKLEIVVNIMNLQNTTLEDNTNTTTVDNGEPEHQNETEANQQLMDYRTQVTKSIAKINITDYHLVSTVCTVLNQVTERSEELSEEAKEVATETYSNLAEELIESLATTEEEIPMDEITSTAGALLLGAGAMLGVLTDNLEVDFTKEVNDTTPKLATVSQNTTKKIEMTGTLLKSVDNVCNALLDRQIQDAQETIIETEQVQVAVIKVSPYNLPGLKMKLESPKLATGGVKNVVSVTIPDDLILPVETSNVRLHIVVLKKNPYVWSNDTESVRTPVVSVTLKDSDQNIVNMENLQRPIKLSVPAGIDAAKATGNLRLKVSVYKNPGGLILFSEKYYSSKASFKLLKSDKIAGLKLALPTNLTSLRVYISNNGTPEFEDIMKEGKIYPQEVFSFVKDFSGYLASDILNGTSDSSNDSVIYFAGGNKTQNVTESYVGVSLDLSNKDTMMVIQDLDPECLGNDDLATCEGKLEIAVEFRTFTMQCMYWLEESQSWSGSGCWLSTDTTDNTLGCECDHLSVFGGSILVAPFEIDPIFDLMLLDTFFDNPVVITVVIMIWVIYTFLVLWARKADRNDREKDSVIRCGGSDKHGKQEYLVCVLTGWWKQAGTTANVFLCMKGTLGHSQRFCLTSSRECLQTGYEDWFLLKTEHSLGNLQTVSLWHDNSGTSPHWFVNQVFVKDVHRGESWMFLFSDWLALDRGNLKLTSVTLDNITEEELRYRQKHHFFVKTTEDLRDRHIWVSIFSKPLRSSFSRVQRLSCCLSILLTTMLADLMLYGIPTDDPQDQISAGGFQLSLSQLAIGIQSSLMVFPINIIIIQVFLRSKPSPPRSQSQSSTTKRRCKDSAPKDERKSLTDMAWYKRIWNFPVLKSRWRTASDCSSEQSDYFSCHWSLDDIAGLENDGFVDRDFVPMEDNSVDSTRGSDVSLEDYSTVKQNISDTDRRKILPHWCVYIAWGVVMTSCVLCSYFVMLYGLKYGYTRSVEWLVAFVIGFFSSTLIQEPIKAVAVAVLFTFILKKTVQFQDVEPKIEHDREMEFETIMSSQEPKQPVMEPLSKKVLRKIRSRLRLEWMMDLTFKNLAVQAMYLALILVIINSHKPVDTAYMSAVTIRNLFVNSKDHMHLAEVKTSGTFYRYLHETLVPGMEAMMQTGKREAYLGSNHYLIGSIRLRQLRIKEDTSCPSAIKQLFPELGCDAGYGTSLQDTNDYDVGWATANSSANATWPYSKASMLNGMSFPGQFGTYPGSGYVVNMPLKSMERGEIIDVFSSLEESGWFDVRTRAVFVEFTLYNPNVDLFHVVVLLFENSKFGSVSPMHHIYTNSMIQYREGSQQLVFYCEVMFVLLNMLFAYIQLIKLFRDGRKRYFSDVWNVIELIQISLSFATVGVSSHRYATVVKVFSEIKKKDEEAYINMYPLVFSDLVIQYVNAGLLILLMFEGVRLLHLHPRPRVIARTLSGARSELLNFSFIFFVILIAYSHSSFLFFNKVMHHYRAFGSTFAANVALLLGNGEMADLAENYNFLGPLFIVMFATSMNFCLVTTYMAILNMGLFLVRDKKCNKKIMLLNDYIIYRLKEIIGLK